MVDVYLEMNDVPTLGMASNLPKSSTWPPNRGISVECRLQSSRLRHRSTRSLNQHWVCYLDADAVKTCGQKNFEPRLTVA